jgi:hypothetical protein
LRVSCHVWWEDTQRSGRERVDLLAAYREAGMERVQALIRSSAESDEALESFAEDCRAAGAELG